MADRVEKENATTTVFYDGSCPLCTREIAFYRKHAGGGEIVSGARAFAVMWSALPRFRWLGRAALLTPVTPLLEGAYRLFLPLRPWLQRRFSRS